MLQDLHQMRAREWQQHAEQAFNPDARGNYAQRCRQDTLAQGIKGLVERCAARGTRKMLFGTLRLLRA
jgi:hypothetical protein